MKIDKSNKVKAEKLQRRLEECVEDYVAGRLGVQAFMRRSDGIREELRKYTGQSRPKRNPKNKKILKSPAVESEEAVVETCEQPESPDEPTLESLIDE